MLIKLMFDNGYTYSEIKKNGIASFAQIRGIYKKYAAIYGLYLRCQCRCAL